MTEIKISHAGPNAFFDLPGLRFSVKLVDAQFPPYQQVIPEHSEHIVRGSNVLLEVEGTDRLKLSARDLHLAVSGDVPAEVETGGSVAIGARDEHQRQSRHMAPVRVAENAVREASHLAAAIERGHSDWTLPQDPRCAAPQPSHCDAKGLPNTQIPTRKVSPTSRFRRARFPNTEIPTLKVSPTPRFRRSRFPHTEQDTRIEQILAESERPFAPTWQRSSAESKACMLRQAS